MTDVIPDPRPPKRVKASKKQWATIAASKAGPCRARQSSDCSGPPHLHHLVNRSQGGDDVAENIVSLCQGHHASLHDHTPGWRGVADRIAWTMSEAEQEYVIEKKGVVWLNSAYPIKSFVDPLRPL